MSAPALIREGAVPGLCLGPDDPLRLPEMEPGPPASGGRQTGEQGSRAWVAAERYRTRKGRGISCLRWEPCGARRPFLTFQTLLARLIVSPSLVLQVFLFESPLRALGMSKGKEGVLSPPCPETNFS